MILGKQAVKNDALITRPVWSLVLIVNAFFLHVTHLNSVNVLHMLLNYLSTVIPLFSCFQSTNMCRYIIYFPIISLKNSCQVRNFTRNCTSLYFEPILKVSTWTWRGLGRGWIFNCKSIDPSALEISILFGFFLDYCIFWHGLLFVCEAWSKG